MPGIITKPVVTVEGISKSAVTYDRGLRRLPALQLAPLYSKFAMNVVMVPYERRKATLLRSAGGTTSYYAGKQIKYSAGILKFQESVLHPKLVRFAMYDNILNYYDREEDVQFYMGKPLDLKDKRHPMEQEILNNIVITHAEDVANYMFHAERDEEALTPDKAFDGYFTKIDSLITEGEIAAEKGNLVTTGEIKFTEDAPNAPYEAVTGFLLKANLFLLSATGGIPQLIMSEEVDRALLMSYKYKTRNYQDATFEQMHQAIRDDVKCPQLEFVTDPVLGTGGRLTLLKKGLLDFGYNTTGAPQYVQVRAPYEDPNLVQFWLQAAYDTAIEAWHKKVFQTNEQKNVAPDLCGDYKPEPMVDGPATAGAESADAFNEDFNNDFGGK